MKNATLYIFTCSLFLMSTFNLDAQSYSINNEPILLLKAPYKIQKSVYVKKDNFKCEKGKDDARKYDEGKRKHKNLGRMFGPFAVIGAALGKPTPFKSKNTMLKSDNKDMFNDPIYLECYQKEARKANIKASLKGLVFFILAIIIGVILAGLLILALFAAIINSIG